MAEEGLEQEDAMEDTYVSLMDQVEAVLQMLENAETTLHTLQRPIETLALHQLGNVPFLVSSPFRHQGFSLKRAPSLRIPFHTICSELRAHCLPLVRNGEIYTSPFLREQLNVTSTTTSFPQLLGALRYGLN